MLLLPACGTMQRETVVNPGGSVADFDRSPGAARSLETGPKGRVLVQSRRFLLLYAFSLGLSVGLLFVQVDLLGRSLYGAKVVADGTCFLVNFVVMRGYVFRATAGITQRLRTAMEGLRRAA